MKKKQYYGIKFPFTMDNQQGLFIDLNGKLEDKIASQIVHVLLTPKRQRIRMPEFGTDLMKYVFEPSDDVTWSMVENEVKAAIEKYVPNTTLKNIQILRDANNDNGIFINLKYSVIKGNTTENNEITIKV